MLNSARWQRVQDSACLWSWHSYRHLHYEDPALHILLPAAFLEPSNLQTMEGGLEKTRGE